METDVRGLATRTRTGYQASPSWKTGLGRYGWPIPGLALALAAHLGGPARAEPAPDSGPGAADPFQVRIAPIRIEATEAEAPDYRPPKVARSRALARKLGAKVAPVAHPEHLERFFKKLDALEEGSEGQVRILQLGDSHIAADYITRTARRHLQARFGKAGRGFVAVDQRAQFGGRRLSRDGWQRVRIVDEGAQGAFGFSGMRVVSEHAKAKLSFRRWPHDDRLVVYYHTHPAGAAVKLYAGRKYLGRISTRSRRPRSRTKRFTLPPTRRKSHIRLVAQGPGAQVFGLSFESDAPGVLLDSIGPVGADAAVYLRLDRDSLRAQLRSLAPDLVVLMIGGNDALMLRRKRRSLDQVVAQHRALVRQLRENLPQASCLLFGPMDAGERVGKRIRTKEFVVAVRDLQKQVAQDLGCAFWDSFDAMGGPNAFGRWLDEGLMNQDLVHPRSLGGDLLGHLFSSALLEAYAGES